MIYVKCRRRSRGARALVSALVAVGCPARRWHEEIVQQGRDLVVCWGERFRSNLVPVLNGEAGGNDKFAELMLLATERVPVPACAMRPWAGWVGRSRHHHGANDLLRGGGTDYYVEIVPTTHEFRVHVFRDPGPDGAYRVFRLGQKVPAPGLPAVGVLGGPHPIYRSRTAGWRLDYSPERRDNLATLPLVREVARGAVRALGYCFGAVDVGVHEPTGRVVVFEVNSAPGLDNGTAVAYARQIAAWTTGGQPA